MTDQREVLKADGTTRLLTEADKLASLEAAKKIRADKKAKFARILERGVLVDRLAVALPPEFHGEWAPVDQVDRWLAMGFENGAKYFPETDKRALHGAADGFIHVGDVVFVVLPKEDKEIMEEVRDEMYVATHGSPQEKKELRQKEEKDFESKIRAEARELPVVEEGSAKAARREELHEAVHAATAQVPHL